MGKPGTKSDALAWGRAIRALVLEGLKDEFSLGFASCVDVYTEALNDDVLTGQEYVRAISELLYAMKLTIDVSALRDEFEPTTWEEFKARLPPFIPEREP